MKSQEGIKNSHESEAVSAPNLDPKVLLIDSLNQSFKGFSDDQAEVLKLLDRTVESIETFEDRVVKTRKDFESRINGSLEEEDVVEAFEKFAFAAGKEPSGPVVEEVHAAMNGVFQSLPLEHRGTYLESLIRNLGRPPSEHSLMFPGFLTMLVSQVEVVIRRYAENISGVIPEAIIGQDEKITFRELIGFQTVDEVKSYWVQHVVDRVLRGSLTDWVKFFVDKIGVSSDSVVVSPEVLEVTQRRHCFIHNDGLASRQYLANTDSSQFELGEYLAVDAEYVRRAADALQTFVLSLHCAIADKLSGKNKDARNNLSSFVSMCSFYLLQDKRYEALKMIGNSIPKLRLDESNQIILDVNIWLAHKFSGSFEEVEEEIAALDSDLIPINLRLAKAALLGQHEEAIKLIDAMLLTGDIKKQHIVTWPLLSEVYPLYREHDNRPELDMRDIEKE
ncbi:hypothetical protein QP365_12565 [Corynebacterium aurimucosum]|nr:hypothetical protein [Corynebacterium aurimucosum]NJJ84282.1 hypothetical protein [Corynebacterium aurimucosum]